jgi:ketosteroid isomerase-like protein
MASNERALEAVKTVYDGFSSGDLPKVLSNMAPDIEWTEAEGFPYKGTYIGPDAIVSNVFVKLATEWENYRAVPLSFVGENDTIVALGEYSGTYLKTKKSFRAPFVHVWTVKDGKLTNFVQHTDTVLVAQALK